MSKLRKWILREQPEPVRKNYAAAVETAYLVWAEENVPDEYRDEAVGSYSLHKYGSTSSGELWLVDSWWSYTYYLATASGAEPFAMVGTTEGEPVEVKEFARTLDETVIDAIVAKDGKAIREWIDREVRKRNYRVVKADEAQKYTLGVAYPANEVDAHGDWQTPEDLELSAWDYIVNSRNVGTMHEDGTDGAGVVVESYIYRGPDWTVKGVDGAEQTIEAGDWLMGVVWTDETWGEIEKGDGSGSLTGFSIQGLAYRDEDADPPADA